MSKGKFAAGTIFGAIAGVIAGILTAPKSGKETRADLKLKADEIKGGAVEKTDDLKGKASEVVKDVKVAAEDLKVRAERAVDGAKEGFNSKK